MTYNTAADILQMGSNQFSSNRYIQTTGNNRLLPDSSFSETSEGLMPKPKINGKRKKNVN